MRIALRLVPALLISLAMGALTVVATPLPSPAPNAPPLPPGTLPMYVADPVLPDNPNDPAGFGCFTACGPSCACVGRTDSQTTTDFAGGKCAWHLVQCLGHSFCTWHDTCYNRCDFQYPGHVSDGSIHRSLCYRGCDLACIDGHDPQPIDQAWEPESLDPGPPPEALGAAECALRLAAPSMVQYDRTLVFAELLGCK